MKRLLAPVALLLLLPQCSAKSSATTSAPEPSTTVTATVAEPVPPGPPLPELTADPREELLASHMYTILTREHLRAHALDDEVSKEAFDVFLDSVDGGKLFLLQAHVDALSVYSEHIDDQFRQGNLKLARQGAALLAERQRVVAGIIADLLKVPFDFTEAEELETDAEKVGYATDEADLRGRWKRLLKLQVLERVDQMIESEEAVAKAKAKANQSEDEMEALTEEIPKTLEGKHDKAREDMAQSYAARFARLEDPDPLRPAETLINAVATVYDPHTLYLAPADKENFDIEMTGALEGIGAVLAEEGHYIKVREVVPGGASWQQGDLEAGDVIMGVAQGSEKAVDVFDMPIDKVVAMIRGKKGTVVVLTVRKPDDSIQRIAITRDVVVIEAAYARGAVLDLGEKAEPVGYVFLPSFYGDTRSSGAKTERNATDDVRALLEELEKQKIGSVILDLRGNGGGLLPHARDIGGLFIEKGPIVQTQYSDGEAEILADEDPRIAFTGRVVVLVDRFSASASEIVAGALQDYDRALIVGTGPTHGKGTVQALFDLDRASPLKKNGPLGVVKLTIQQYFRVSGESTQWRGVEPDIALPDPLAHIESGERFLEHSIPWSSVKELSRKNWDGPGWKIDELTKESEARQEKNETFQLIEKRSALIKSREDATKVPLSRDAWTTKRDKEEKELEAVNPKLDELPSLFTVKPIENGASVKVDDPGAKDRLEQWKKTLARDPWVEEALRIINDASSSGS